MRGDRVEVVVDTGDGTTTFDIVATKAGRRVEVSNSRGIVEVSELTRSGNVVRSGRFMATSRGRCRASGRGRGTDHGLSQEEAG